MGWRWSPWLPFPKRHLDDKLEFPDVTKFPGVYELRRRSTGQLVLFGQAEVCARRMRSLVPAPWGTGTRNNSKKREYVLKHCSDIEYRTVACRSVEEAKARESELRQSAADYEFGT